MALLEANGADYAQFSNKNLIIQFVKDTFGESQEENSCLRGMQQRVIVGLRNIDPGIEALFKPALAFENLSQRLGEWGGKLQSSSTLDDFLKTYLGIRGQGGILHAKKWQEVDSAQTPEKLLSHVQDFVYQESFGDNLSYKNHSLVQQKFATYFGEETFVNAAQRFIARAPLHKRFKTDALDINNH